MADALTDGQGSVRQVTLMPSTTDAVAGANKLIAAVGGLGGYKQALIELVLTDAQAAAGDTLDVFVDTSVDAGGSWLNIVHFTQILGNGADAIKIAATIDPAGAAGTSVVNFTSDAAAGAVRPSIFGDQLRVRYTIVNGGGGTQNFTFSVVAELKA